jgi:hypothetical protein
LLLEAQVLDAVLLLQDLLVALGELLPERDVLAVERELLLLPADPLLLLLLRDAPLLQVPFLLLALRQELAVALFLELGLALLLTRFLGRGRLLPVLLRRLAFAGLLLLLLLQLLLPDLLLPALVGAVGPALLLFLELRLAFALFLLLLPLLFLLFLGSLLGSRGSSACGAGGGGAWLTACSAERASTEPRSVVKTNVRASVFIAGYSRLGLAPING